MTEEKLRRMMKYVQWIRGASWQDGHSYCASLVVDSNEEAEKYDKESKRYEALGDYLIHRMEREMKR